jgi:hypothetical protein
MRRVAWWLVSIAVVTLDPRVVTAAAAATVLLVSYALLFRRGVHLRRVGGGGFSLFFGRGERRPRDPPVRRREPAPRADLELVVMVGVDRRGATSYVAQRYGDTHAIVRNVAWPTARGRRARQVRAARRLLAGRRSVVVADVNPTKADRARLVALAHEYRARAVAVSLPAPVDPAPARESGQESRRRVGNIGLGGTCKALELPSIREGFDEVVVVR